jgi:hypothetical protein
MEILIVDQSQLLLKDKNFFKSTAISGKDLDRLMEKDERQVK